MRVWRIPLMLCATAMLVAMAVDLVTKVLAIRGIGPLSSAVVVYNPNHSSLGERIAICAGGIAMVALLAHLARRRGVGEIPVTWIAIGVVDGGVMSQGVSALVWEDGVPDFIWLGKWVWNIADFEIGMGLMACMLSIALSAIAAFARSTRA